MPILAAYPPLAPISLPLLRLLHFPQIPLLTRPICELISIASALTSTCKLLNQGGRHAVAGRFLLCFAVVAPLSSPLINSSVCPTSSKLFIQVVHELTNYRDCNCQRRAHAHGPLLRQAARLHFHGAGGGGQPGSHPASRGRS